MLNNNLLFLNRKEELNILFNKLSKIELKQIFFKINNRSIKIASNMFNKQIYIHNGRYYIPLYIRDYMLKISLGRFAFTKKILIKKKKKRYKK